MMPSRGMGAIRPSKMPGGEKKSRRDDTDFTQYRKGGSVKKYNDGGAVPMDPEAGYVGNAGVGQLDDATLKANIQKEAAAKTNSARLKALQDEMNKRNKRFEKYKMAEGGEVWDNPNPAKKHKKLSSDKKKSAKAMAKAAGRPYPNLIDNMRASRK
jgi:hypothetical protein